MDVSATEQQSPTMAGEKIRSTSELHRHSSHSEDTLVHASREGDEHAHAHFDLPDVDMAVAAPVPVLDIEHMPVDNDPREWSNKKKNMVLVMMSVACVSHPVGIPLQVTPAEELWVMLQIGPMISPSIYNPVIDDVRNDLHASETQVGLSLSLYILFQGCVPVVWSSIAELYTIGSAVGSRAQTMPVLIGMRCVQAMGSSAVLSIGAGSLADMFEIHERGKKLGLYYGMPLMGPSLGPIIGGALGSAFGWRSTMYFLACFAALMVLGFFFFPDSWRKERSKAYQKAVEAAIKRALQHDAHKEKKRQRKLAKGLASSAVTPAESGFVTPATRRGSHADVEIAEKEVVLTTKTSRWGRMIGRGGGSQAGGAEEHESIKLSPRDVNPLPQMASIFKKLPNSVILFCSGLLFSAQYTISYTASLTLARAPYNYDALLIGVVLLAFGVGNILGSVLGGRYSDFVLRKLKKANGGVSYPEMRLKSTTFGMPFLIASFLAYAWCADYKTNIAGLVVPLFFAGFFLMTVYSSTLAYLVDSNPVSGLVQIGTAINAYTLHQGRSSSAVACNSFCRGATACVMSQVAVPIQNAIGDGGLYTMFAGIIALSCSGVIMIIFKGQKWRDSEHRFPWQRAKVVNEEVEDQGEIEEKRQSDVKGETR
ncbi:hypothetical protein P7C73_g807, partial [Tremellales sp. Uapishka_1]